MNRVPNLAKGTKGRGGRAIAVVEGKGGDVDTSRTAVPDAESREQ